MATAKKKITPKITKSIKASPKKTAAKKKIAVKNFHGLSIDSRTIRKNNIFLTIKGKNNNFL